MKKLIFMIVIALSLICIDAYTCPEGWTSVSFPYQYVPDCDVTVYYCYIILPTGEFRVWIEEVMVEVPCGLAFVNTSQFWDNLKERVRENFKNVVTFPPCPLVVFNVELRRAECWKVQNIPPNPLQQTPGYVKYISCGMIGYCEWLYKICYDTKLHEVKEEFVSFNSVSSELCPNSMPQLPPQGKTWDDDWTTDCYGVTCFQ